MDTWSMRIKACLAAAVMLLAVSAFIFVLKYDSRPAHGVGVFKDPGLMFHFVHTQSADGKTMYQWEWIQKERKWKRWTHNLSGDGR